MRAEENMENVELIFVNKKIDLSEFYLSVPVYPSRQN